MDLSTLVVGLLAWVSAYTGLPVTDERPPYVELTTAEQLWSLRYPTIPFETRKHDVAAIYDWSTLTMYLPEDFDPSSLENVSFVVHELAHHLQVVNEVDPARYCPFRSVERLAYDAQFAFLSAAGIEDPMAYIGIDPFLHLLVTSCPHNT